MLRRAVRRVRVAVLAMLCAVAATACAPLFPGHADGPFNGDWMLMRAGWRDALFTVEGTGITLISDGESVSGFSGCRDYAFRLSGDAEEFSFGEALLPGRSGPASGSFGACNGSLERVESRYLSVLLAADGAEVQNDELVVTAGHSYLVFAAIPPFPGPRLIGTEWVLEAYGETWRDEWATEVIGMPTLRFVGQDRIVGSLGCGGIVATYRVVRTEVFVISLHRSGAEECVSAFSEQDQLLAQFLDGFRAYLLGDTHLVLTHERLQLMYRAAEGRAD